MGWQIALTALVVLCLCFVMAPTDTKGTKTYAVFSVIGGISFLAIPIGLIIQIWQ